jgi:hypothetical protein
MELSLQETQITMVNPQILAAILFSWWRELASRVQCLDSEN